MSNSSFDTKIIKTIALSLGSLIFLLIVWYAMDVFLIAFSSLLLAILLNAIGRGVKRITHLPYTIALLTGLICILGLLTLTFWLYSPLIAEQFKKLMEELPQAMATLRGYMSSLFGGDVFAGLSFKKEDFLSNEKFFTRVLSVFSSTLGGLIGFALFLLIGLYFALNPDRYVQWIVLLVPPKKQRQVLDIMEKIGRSLRWWLLGKLLSMSVIGILTFTGLWLLHVSLAFILGLLAALLTFIPYVGAILAAIPAILIGFTQSPLLGAYVILLYLIIHLIEGYMITPFIEQRTVAIPPALTILTQALLLMLIGALGLALATPLMVVFLALVHYTLHYKELRAPSHLK